MAEAVLLESAPRSPNDAAGSSKVGPIFISRGDEDMDDMDDMDNEDREDEDTEDEDIEDEEDTEDEEESFNDVVGDSQPNLFQSHRATLWGIRKGKNIAATGEDPDEFDPRWIKDQSSPSSSQFQCLHIRKAKDLSQIFSNSEKVGLYERGYIFNSWEHEDSSPRWEWTMHLIIFPREEGSKMISLSPDTRFQLRRHWNIPKICFDAHDHLWSGAMNYAPVSDDALWKGYLVRCDRSWGSACTLAISHNSSSNSTYGVCIDLRERAAAGLITYLERHKQWAGNPLFVPISLARLYIRVTITINRRHNKDFYDIQTSMKTDDYIKSPLKVRTALDLVKFTSKLTSLATSSAGVTQLCSTQDRIIHFLWTQLELLKVKTPDGNEVLTSLGERLAFTRELLRAERQHNEYIKAAAQAQVQMVYSLTAQRDNEHSFNLARLSHSQNNINIQISKFAAYESLLSNRMAKESLKYGVDMQVIAAVTLGFLPGTFVATLFSTSFWNFQPDNEGKVVSRWVWLYGVVTTVLTLAVLAAWRIVSGMRTDGLPLPPELDLGTLPGVDESGDIEEKNLV